jgi:hypothetical protein
MDRKTKFARIFFFITLDMEYVKIGILYIYRESKLTVRLWKNCFFSDVC